MKDNKTKNISDLSKSTIAARELLKTKNGRKLSSTTLTNLLIKNLKVSERTAYRIINDLHLSNQISSVRTFNINIGQ